MNLIIGVLGRPKTLDRDITSFSKAITDVIIKYGNIPLGIIAPVTDISAPMTKNDIIKLHQIIDLCDGFILQGGTDYYQYDLEAIKYIYEKNIPILGICLGMQSMGAFFGASLVSAHNHNHAGIDYVHEVKIDDQSKLRKIIGSNQIRVNSRHNDMVANNSYLTVVGSSDQVIEAIEHSDSLFFLGVQWHPEDMIKYDEASRKIFDALFSSCKIYHIEKEKI